MIAAHSDRDILISPNRTLQHAGKTVYFQPTSTARTQRSHEPLVVGGTSKDATSDQQSVPTSPSSSTVPWEEPLKHAIYLVLNNKVDNYDDESDVDIAIDADRNYSTRLVKHTISILIYITTKSIWSVSNECEYLIGD